AVMVGAVVGEEPTAEARDGTGVVRAKVLEEIRHRGERPGWQPRTHRRTRLIIEPGHHRIDGRIARLDARNRRLEHLVRRHLAPAHQRSEADPVVLVKFGESAHEAVLRPRQCTRAFAKSHCCFRWGILRVHPGGPWASPLINRPFWPYGTIWA